MNNFPNPDTKSLIAYYGEVGENQTSIKTPYELIIAWDLKKSISRMTCHKKVADSITLCMENILKEYKESGIKKYKLNVFGGCLNVRKMRGGSSWSVHSFGAAIDFLPDENQLKWGKDKASLARPEYEAFWEIWENEGWMSLGRRKNYDWMHVQATK